MESSMKKSMLNNHWALKIINILTMYTSWKRPCMGLSKLQGSGMRGLVTFFYPMAIYERGMIDKTLFIKKSNSEIILVQIYVDDIILGATKDSFVEPSGVQALKNPNPLKDVEGLDVLAVVELS